MFSLSFCLTIEKYSDRLLFVQALCHKPQSLHGTLTLFLDYSNDFNFLVLL